MARDAGSIRWHRGGWEIRVQHDGRRITRRVKGTNDRAGRRLAEAATEQLATELGKGTESMLVWQLLERHELVSAPGWSPSTRASHRHHVAPLVAELGLVPVAKLRAVDIETVYARWVRSGLAPSTVRRRHSILAAALAAAERWEMVAVSPARKVVLPRRASQETADLPTLVDVLAAVARLDYRRLQVAARLALATGCRRGELVGLRWSDIDGDVVSIKGAVVVDGRVAVRQGTKSGDRRPPMLVDPSTVELVREWRRECQAAAMALGAGRLRDTWPILAVPSDPTAWWVPDRITTAWTRHRSTVGLPGLRWHDLRHVAATAWLDAGVPPEIVRARVGHSSTRMTLDVYGHRVASSDRLAADVIAEAARAAGL